MKFPKFDPISFLVREKYPDECRIFSAGNAPLTNSSFRPPSKQSINRAEEKIKNYREELEKLSEEKIKELISSIRSQKAEEEEKNRIYNQPTALATADDYEYWKKADYWSIDEGVALLLGRKPGSVSISSFKNVINSAFKDQYTQLYQLANRSVLSGSLSKIPTPSSFVEWAVEKKIKIPSELTTALPIDNDGKPPKKVKFTDVTVILKIPLSVRWFIDGGSTRPALPLEESGLLKRNGEMNKPGCFLVDMAQGNSPSSNDRKAISDLRKIIRKWLRTDDDPFNFNQDSKTYYPRFKLSIEKDDSRQREKAVHCPYNDNIRADFDDEDDKAGEFLREHGHLK